MQDQIDNLKERVDNISNISAKIENNTISNDLMNKCKLNKY